MASAATYVGGIGYQLSDEDLFVGVESVDDQTHQLGDFSLEGKGLDFDIFFHRFFWGSLLSFGHRFLSVETQNTTNAPSNVIRGRVVNDKALT